MVTIVNNNCWCTHNSLTFATQPLIVKVNYLSTSWLWIVNNCYKVQCNHQRLCWLLRSYCNNTSSRSLALGVVNESSIITSGSVYHIGNLYKGDFRGKGVVGTTGFAVWRFGKSSCLFHFLVVWASAHCLTLSRSRRLVCLNSKRIHPVFRDFSVCACCSLFLQLNS